MPDDKLIDIPVNLEIKSVTGTKELESLVSESTRRPLTIPKPKFSQRPYGPSPIPPTPVYKIYDNMKKMKGVQKATDELIEVNEEGIKKLLGIYGTKYGRVMPYKPDIELFEVESKGMQKWIDYFSRNKSVDTSPFIEINKAGLEKYHQMFKYQDLMPSGLDEGAGILTEADGSPVVATAQSILDQTEDTSRTLDDIRSILEEAMSFRGGFFEPVHYDESFIRSLTGISNPTRGHLQWMERHYKRREFMLEDHKLKLERQVLRSSYMGGIIGKIGTGLRDVGRLFMHHTGIKQLKPRELPVVSANVKAWVAGLVISALTLVTKKVFDTIIGVSKKILNFFVSAAKQAETLKTLLNLLVMPFVTMFTLMFVPLLIMALPLIKTMFGWVIANKDAILEVGRTLGSIFTADNLSMITKGLDGVLYIIESLAGVLDNNADFIDTSSLDKFISSTILAVTNMLQDILMGLVAFCYSPEGHAFIKSLAYSVGKMIGSVFVTIVALLPVILESLVTSILGIISGVGSYLSKATYNLFDMIDGFFGNAISGFINNAIELVNSAIRALNGINIFGNQLFNIPYINSNGSLIQTGSAVSHFADQSIVNNFNINNNMSIPNSGVLKDVMSTGVY